MPDINPALHTAFGARGVAKLCAAIASGESPDLAVEIATLNSLLSSQENKTQALENDGAVVPVLTGLLASAEPAVRRQAALAIASLTLVYQGRIAAADAQTTAAILDKYRSGREAGKGLSLADFGTLVGEVLRFQEQEARVAEQEAQAAEVAAEVDVA